MSNEQQNPQTPDAPTAVSATPDDGSVHVSWTAPAFDGGAAISDYEVSVYDSAGGAASGTESAPELCNSDRH